MSTKRAAARPGRSGPSTSQPSVVGSAAESPASPSGPGGIFATAEHVALTLLPHAEEITRQSVAWTSEHDALYRDMVPLDDLYASSLQCVQLVLSLVAGISIPSDLAIAPESIGRRRAEQLVPLEAVLRSLRVDYRITWESMLEVVSSDTTVDRVESLTGGTARIWDSIDSVSVRVAAAYRAFEADMQRTGTERTQALLGSLLRGSGPVSSIVRQASAHLRLPLDERLIVCCAERIDGGRAASEEVERVLAVRGIRSLWYTELVSVAGMIEAGGRVVSEVADALAPLDRWRVGLSPVMQGLGGVRRHVWLAEAALNALSAGTPGVATFETHALACIAAASEDLSIQLFEQLFAPLSTLRPSERSRILGTVTAYLEGGGSISDTAAGAHCHRNTVINHLRQFERLTGKSLNTPRDIAELVLALEGARHRGEAIIELPSRNKRHGDRLGTLPVLVAPEQPGGTRRDGPAGYPAAQSCAQVVACDRASTSARTASSLVPHASMRARRVRST